MQDVGRIVLIITVVRLLLDLLRETTGIVKAVVAGLIVRVLAYIRELLAVSRVVVEYVG